MIAALIALLAVVNSPVNSVTYACDGTTAAYTVNFPYLSSSDLVVTSTTGPGAVTTLVQITDWSVNLSSTSSTASLTLNSPATKCPAGNTFKIARNTGPTQPTSFRQQTSYSPSVHEQAFDRATMLIQEGLKGVTTPMTGAGTALSPLVMPQASGTQNGFLSATDWNAFSTGGIGAQTFTAPGGTARLVSDKLGDVVSVKDFGATGDGVTDDSPKILAAWTRANAIGARLYAPAGVYRVATNLNLRSIATDFTGEVLLDGGAMLTIGGSAAITLNPPQRFRKITRSGGVTATPTVRVAGTKNQSIEIGTVDYVQLYADTSTGDSGPDSAIAYSTFKLDAATKIELTNNAATTGSVIQWINENSFFIKRTNTLIVSGTYSHNHNWFYTGNFEGASTLTFTTGNNNIIWGGRFETNTQTITFGSGTWANRIVQSWMSNQATAFDMTDPPLANVTDNGMSNIITTLDEMMLHRIPVLEVNGRTTQVFTNSNTTNASSLQGVNVQRYGIDNFQRQAFSTVFTSRLIPVTQGESLNFASDATLFRVAFAVFDTNKTQITGAVASAGSYVLCGCGASWTGDDWTTTINKASLFAAIMSPAVKYVRVTVATGNATLGVPFSYMGIYKLTPRRSPIVEAGAFEQSPMPPAATATPTVGFAPYAGYKVSNTAGGWFTATRALDTSLSAPAVATNLTVTLTSVTGIVNGDLIGIVLDSGAVHWTTVNGAPVGNVVTITVAMPSNAASGNQVVSNGWTPT